VPIVWGSRWRGPKRDAWAAFSSLDWAAATGRKTGNPALPVSRGHPPPDPCGPEPGKRRCRRALAGEAGRASKDRRANQPRPKEGDWLCHKGWGAPQAGVSAEPPCARLEAGIPLTSKAVVRMVLYQLEAGFWCMYISSSLMAGDQPDVVTRQRGGKLGPDFTLMGQTYGPTAESRCSVLFRPGVGPVRLQPA